MVPAHTLGHSQQKTETILHLPFICSLCRDTVGTFPEYPCEEDGGSAPLFVNKDPQKVAHSTAHGDFLFVFRKITRSFLILFLVNRRTGCNGRGGV